MLRWPWNPLYIQIKSPFARRLLMEFIFLDQAVSEENMLEEHQHIHGGCRQLLLTAKLMHARSHVFRPLGSGEEVFKESGPPWLS